VQVWSSRREHPLIPFAITIAHLCTARKTIFDWQLNVSVRTKMHTSALVTEAIVFLVLARIPCTAQERPRKNSHIGAAVIIEWEW